MPNIEYEVQPNKLTVPPSYAARVRSRGLVTRDQLAHQIAQLGQMDASQVYAVWNLQNRAVVENLQNGMSVEVDDLTIASLSISARMETPNEPLPSDAQLNVTLRPDSKLIEAVRSGASLTRVEPTNLSPSIVEVLSPVGDLSALAAGNIVESDGYRQSFDPTRADEGAFLVPTDRSEATVRFETYLARGDRKLMMAVPAGLIGDQDYLLEVRARTKGASPTAPLHIGVWPTPLHTA